MAIDDYDPSTALSAYYLNRSERRTARLWAAEKLLHDLKEIGLVDFFEGAGSDPTAIEGYASNKLWLRVSSGITSAPGKIRAYDGVGDETLLSSWPILTPSRVDVAKRSMRFEGDADLPSDNYRTPDATGGLWTDYDCKAYETRLYINSETLPQEESGAMRDGIRYQFMDQDGYDYDSDAYRAISSAVRVTITGKYESGDYVPLYKDLHGLTLHAAGDVGGSTASLRAVSALIAQSTNYGGGVCTNEMGVQNGAGGTQSVHMANIGIVYNDIAESDVSHTAHGLRAAMYGYKSTAAFSGYSVARLGQDGAVQYALDFRDLICDGAAISMPDSGVGDAGTIIEYDANDYTQYLRSLNVFQWVIGGAVPMTMNANGPRLRAFTVATLPSTSAGTLAYVSDGASNKRFATCHGGTDWRWPDGNTVTT